MKSWYSAFLLLSLAMPCMVHSQDLEIIIEDRLESLVGIAAIDARYVVDWTNPPPAAGTVLDLRYQASGRILEGRVSDGETSLVIRGRVRLLASIPTVTRTIERGEEIGPADLGTMEADLLDLRPGILLAEENVLDHAARRSLAPGRPILARDVKSVPAVERNAIVQLVAVSGPVRIETKAKALDAGAIGQTVRLQNLDSRRVVSGVVIGRGMVEAIPAEAGGAAAGEG